MRRMPPIILQDNNYSCAEACVASVLLYYQDDASHVAFSSPEDGAAPRQIEHQLRKRGYKVLAGNMDWTLLKYLINKNIPIIVCLDGHWLVVCKTENRSIYLMNPLHSSYQKQSIIKFKQQWWDFDSVGTSYLNWGVASYP